MMKLVCSLVATAVLFGVTVGASAQEKGKADPESQFKKLDKNSDGKVSLEEFLGKRTGEKADKAKANFEKRDKDKDGSLSLEEFKAGGKKTK